MDPNAPKPETRPAGKQTTETLMAGERIAEALEIGIEDLRLMSDWRAQKASQPSVGPPQRNIIFLAYGNKSAEQHVLDVVEKVKAAALQDALLVLSLDKVTTLFTFLAIWAKRQWNVRLTCRILFFLLKTHHKQIVASKTMRPMLDSIRTNLRESLQGKKDEMGLILAALKFTEAKVKDQKTKEYVDEEIWNEKNSQSLKKRPFVHVA